MDVWGKFTFDYDCEPLPALVIIAFSLQATMALDVTRDLGPQPPNRAASPPSRPLVGSCGAGALACQALARGATEMTLTPEKSRPVVVSASVVLNSTGTRKYGWVAWEPADLGPLGNSGGEGGPRTRSPRGLVEGHGVAVTVGRLPVESSSHNPRRVAVGLGVSI